MKILMIGLGSIGQRHLRNLRRLYGEQHQIIAYRQRGLNQTFSDDLKIREGINLCDEYNVKNIYDLDEALREKPDISFITNITSLHVPYAIKAAQSGCDLFMEKPISHSLDGIKDLIDIIEKKQLVAMVGFQNRYHVCLQKLREYVEQGVLGRLISVEVSIGERLETMHSYEDYRGTYMARRDMGGGLISNLLIHELDYVYWLFGIPHQVYSVNEKSGSLEIDVEDYCSSIYTIEKDDYRFPVYVHGDFFQSPPTKRCKIIGDKGYVSADLLKHEVDICLNGQTPQKLVFPEFIRNEMFLQQTKHFMECVQERKVPAVSLEDGVVSMKMAMAAKISSYENRVAHLDEVVL